MIPGKNLVYTNNIYSACMKNESNSGNIPANKRILSIIESLALPLNCWAEEISANILECVILILDKEY